MSDAKRDAKKGMARRGFLKSAGAGALAFGAARRALSGSPASQPSGANEDLRLAVVGIGAPKIGVGGRGRQLLDRLPKLSGVRLAALCDVDKAFLDELAAKSKARGQRVAAYGDFRRVLDDKSVDAVVVAMPDHWHALAAIWACQAGKDVYVEKPISYNIREGRQIVAAARKHGRIVQAGMQGRSSSALRQAVEFIQRGQIGPIRYARVINYKTRPSIGKVAGPTAAPASVDYNLWCGPCPLQQLTRKQLHYDWHWVWFSGTGEMGNNAVHYIDMCRWALKQNKPAPRAMSLGGRFGYDDDGETPNTQIVVLDYQPAPIYCEIRGLPEKKGSQSMGKLRGVDKGVVIQCEGGYFAGSHTDGEVFDNQGRRIKEFGGMTWEEMEIAHLANFVAATRSRKPGDLNAEALEGHVSAACSHMANISHRVGSAAAPDALRERTGANRVLSEALDRYREHLRSNSIDPSASREVLGPWVSFDADGERFVGQFADEANALCRRSYRAPFTVPEIA